MKRITLLFIFAFLTTSVLLNAQEKLTFTSLNHTGINCFGMGSTNNGKFIFKSGGETFSYKGFISSIENYNPEYDIWTEIGQGLISRKDHNVEYVPSENKIYIFNGEYSPSSTYNPAVKLYASRKSKVLLTDAIEIIDLKSNKVTITESNPYPVANAGSAVWNNKIYFFGGWNPMGYSDRLYEYDPAKDDWERLEDMPEAKHTTGKIVDGILYTFGGHNDETVSFKTIHAYNIKEEKWTLAGELPAGVSANAIASDGRNIWIIGSDGNLNFLAAFDTKTKKITTFESNLQGRLNSGAEVIGNTLYVFGGIQPSDKRPVIAGAQCVDISKYMNKDK